MSPILVRPVREQFEHDRVIRVLQAKYKRKYEVAINPGAEQNASVGIGDLTMYPDLVLFSQERVRKIQGTVEVETTESINTLEAMAEWGPFSRLRTPFFLYVPANTIDTVRRLCSEHAIDPAEIWTYHTALDQLRFTMVHRSPDAPKGSISEHKPKVAAAMAAQAAPAVDTAVAPAGKATPATAAKAAKGAPAKAAAPKPAKNGKPDKPALASTKKAVATSAAKPAKTNAASAGKASSAGRSSHPTKSAKSAGVTKSSKSAKSADVHKSAKSAKSADAHKSAKSAKSADVNKSAKSAGSTKSAKSKKSAKSSK